MIQETIVPKEPPPEFEFIADPPSISAFDLDVVKLTAQFVARNGRQFLTQLMQKEQRNYQFDFLRPQHSLFNYFTKLVEQYTKVPGQGGAGVLGPGKEGVYHKEDSLHCLSVATVLLCGAPGQMLKTPGHWEIQISI